MSTVAVVGASGFVGSACAEALERAGCEVRRIRAPRLTTDDPASAEAADAVAELVSALGGAAAVVNCAGNPDASSPSKAELTPANAVLPAVVGAAARAAEVGRYVHVSSAVVQGRRPVLDSTDQLDLFSAYARSKAAGESAARGYGPAATTVYRPPSVHAASRRVTRQLGRIARSRVASVARPGTSPTPQTHIDNVASALVMLAVGPALPPPVVHHPWEGHTTAGLLRLLGGGRRPRELPAGPARLVVRTLHMIPRIQPYARRIEMVWFGQRQAPSWLTEQGWRPVTTESDWLALARPPGAAHPTPEGRTAHD